MLPYNHIMQNLKLILNQTRQKLCGRCIDWTHLIGDVLTHYWYGVQCKLYDFIKNKKLKGLSLELSREVVRFLIIIFLCILKQRM